MRIEWTSLVGGVAALFAASLAFNRALSEWWPGLRVDLDIGPWWSLTLGVSLAWVMRDAFGSMFRDDDG